jgi:phage repressor protein C with HTH and peptisase S24 domain
MTVQDFDSFFQRLTERLRIGSQSELARVLGVNRSAITQAKQRNAVPYSWIVALARRFDLDPDWLASGHGRVMPPRTSESVYQHIPKVQARLCAGGGSFEVEEAIEEYYAFRSDWLHRKGNPLRMVLMDVMGDSMEPLIEEGDTVLIDQSKTELLAGRIYALGVDDTVMIKRIEKHPGKLVLRSANPVYEPIFLQGEEIDTVRIIGTLIWSCRELT